MIKCGLRKKTHSFLTVMSLCITMGLTACGMVQEESTEAVEQKVDTTVQEETLTVDLTDGMRDGRELFSTDVTDKMYDNATSFQEGDLTRLAKAMRKAQSGGEVTVGVIGGSITEGYSASSYQNCYASHLESWWTQRFPQAKIHFINAGIAGTSSYLGVHRVQEDLLDHDADVIVVEFSVNDGNDAFYKKSYDNLVRRILKDDNEPAVILLFTTQENGTNAQANDSLIGFRYRLPMISYANAVLPEIEEGNFTWKDISPDNVHPNDRGHAVIGELLARYLDHVYDRLDEIEDKITPFEEKALTVQSYMDACIMDASELTPSGMGSFEVKHVNKYYKDNWHTTGGEEPIEFEIEAADIGIAYQRTTDGKYGQFDVYVDDVLVKTLNGDFSDGWGSTFTTEEIYSSKEKELHHIRIVRNPDSKGDCFTIVGLLIS